MLGHADKATTLKYYIYNPATDRETEEMVLDALSEGKVTKRAQKIIRFSEKKRAETLILQSFHTNNLMRKMRLEQHRECP